MEYEDLSSEESEAELIEQAGENSIEYEHPGNDGQADFMAEEPQMSEKTLNLEVAIQFEPSVIEKISNQLDDMEGEVEANNWNVAKQGSQPHEDVEERDNQFPDPANAILPYSLEEIHICSWDELQRKKRTYPPTNVILPSTENSEQISNHGRQPESSQSESVCHGRKVKGLDELYRAEAKDHLQAWDLSKF